MEFNSGFLENLKLLLKDKYVVTDRDLTSLSGIIFSFELGDIAEKGLLTSLYFLMEKNKLTFPLSYNYMKSLWETTFKTVSFNKTLSLLASEGLISLRRMKEESFFNSLNINKNKDSDIKGQEFYLVVYGTAKYNEFVKELKDGGLLQVPYVKPDSVILTEGVNFGDLDLKYKVFANNVINLSKQKLLIDADLESFQYDSLISSIDFNFLFTIPDLRKGNVKDKDINRVFRKWIKSDMIRSVEGSLDSSTKVFMALDLDMRSLPTDMKKTTDLILTAVNEIIDLAVGGVQNG